MTSSAIQRLLRVRIGFVGAICLASVGAVDAPAMAQWLQWGGPGRNFVCDSTGLAEKWPKEGPKKLWSRDLGGGYTAILVDGDRLYTMYRVEKEEFVVCLEANTGKTVWEKKYDSPFHQGMAEFGPGPHATPLIVDDRLYTIGVNALLCCWNKTDGKEIWRRDLKAELDANIPGRGYSSSPIAWKNTIILPVGGKPGQGLMAFDQKTGKDMWKATNFEEVSHSSPILIRFAGKDQLVFFTVDRVAGMNPDTGAVIWEHEFKTEFGANIATPTWCSGDILFCSAAYGSGSRAIKLVEKDGAVTPKELWHSKQVQLHHSDALTRGDVVYCSSGSFGVCFVTAVRAATGEVLWKKRGFAKANLLLADGKLIILDEGGQLAIASPTDKTLKVLSKCQVTERVSWTVPTLAGKTLYVRDNKKIMALDLGSGA